MFDVSLSDRAMKRHAGLTLLELVVVMAVLVAIAAILVPLLPSYVGKANQSAAATNMTELDKAIETFRVTYTRCPNHFDSLLNESGTRSGLVPSGGGNLAPITLDKAGPLSRLQREGITMVYDIADTIPTDDADFHATLNPYLDSQPDGAGRPIETGGKVMGLKQPYTEKTMPGVILNPNHLYAVFGIGKRCNLCGPDGIVKDAPVFGQHKDQNTPSEAYQRYCAVFDIGLDDDDDTKYNAKFVGCIALVGKRIHTANDLVGYYEDNQFEISKPRE